MMTTADDDDDIEGGTWIDKLDVIGPVIAKPERSIGS